MTTKKSGKQLLAEIQALRLETRGEIAGLLVDTINTLDKMAAEGWEPQEVPTDLRTLRSNMASFAHQFAGLAGVTIVVPPDPAALIPQAPISPQ